MANHASHGSLPYPIRGARYTLQIPYLDADGDPTDPTTPDTEISKDNGAFADCAEEVTLGSGARGNGMLTLSGAETDCSFFSLWAGSASGPKATLLDFYVRALAVLESGTAQAGGASSITLAAAGSSIDLAGCFVKTTGGTGGGGTGGANNQARKIMSYNPRTKVATVSPAWETNPDVTTTYEILLPEGMTVASFKNIFQTPVALAPALGIIAAGVAQATGNDTTHIKLAAATTQATNNLIGATVLIIAGTGAGQAGRLVDAYDGSTKICTVSPAWDTAPDNTSEYIVIGSAPASTANVPTVALSTASRAALVDEVWDEAIAGHLTGGTTGARLNSAASAGDPLSNPVPGAYAPGTAGFVLGANLNTTVSSRAAPADIPSAVSIAAAVWASVMEGSNTAIQFMRGFASALFGKSSGLEGTTALYRDMADTKTRIQATVDANGNRSAVTKDLT